MIEVKISGNAEVIHWEYGSPTREFLYVEDAAEGIVLVAERYNGEEPVNLGSGQELSIRDLVNIIAEEVGFIGKIVWDSTKPNGQPRRCLDITRAREWFQFEAETPFRQGLRKTIAWHLAQRKSSGEVLSTADRI